MEPWSLLSEPEVLQRGRPKVSHFAPVNTQVHALLLDVLATIPTCCRMLEGPSLERQSAPSQP